jgi:hypothetical protein
MGLIKGGLKMKEKIEKALKNPLMTMGLFLIIILLCVFVFSTRSYDMVLQLGDKKFHITPSNLEIAFGEFGVSMVKLYSIENEIIPNEQADHLNDIADLIKRDIIDHHILLLNKKGIGKEYYNTEGYKGYINITDVCLAALKVSAKTDFKRLSTINKTNEAEELNIFIKNCIAKYISEYGELVKSRWSLTNITADENYQWTRAIVPAIAEKIDNIFRQAYKIKIKYDIEAEELRSKTVKIKSNN